MARPPKSPSKKKLTNTTTTKQTPLMKQYNQIKGKHPDAMLLFRVGDFYETFGDDAVKAAKILDITLTKRANGAASEIALAGFPHHALDNYLPRLVRAGLRVAICDQLEDPKAAKGIVKRGVTELVTPGLVLGDNVLENKKNNYLASIHFYKNKKYEAVGAAFLDLSTGEFLVAEGEFAYIEQLLERFAPSEIIYSKANKKEFEKYVINGENNFSTFSIEEWIYSLNYSYEKLTKHFGTSSLKGFGVESMHAATIAAGAVLYYLETTEHHEKNHIISISRVEQDKYVWLDSFTTRNLELLVPMHGNGCSLIEVLDKTVTPMGARLLRKWVAFPLKDAKPIQNRLRNVAILVEKDGLQGEISSYLKEVGDLERLISKVAVGRINPKELVKLRTSLAAIPIIKDILLKSKTNELEAIGEKIILNNDILKKLQDELEDNPPLAVQQGTTIKKGVHKELDELRGISTSAKDFLEKLRQREIVKTQITSLKINFNKVFGYYIEVSNAHKTKIPTDWIRKQTLVNAERYITPELKEWEEKIVTAEDKIASIEYTLYHNLVSEVAKYVKVIQQNAKYLSMLDALCSLAEVATQNNYALPEISEDNSLEIREGRHPVIEKLLPIGEQYVPNDIVMNPDNEQIFIITGPNMAGKSALLRQTALIVLMAQIGSFVPAKSAKIGVVDKVFTRVGASDNIAKGESTFMVEMSETASILNNLSDRSLVLMDEIGRGTSTYDGISIAWAIVEYLHSLPNAKPKTLFATHYHELNELKNEFDRIKNYNVSVKEVGGKIIFLRKLKEGGSEHSFGINVASLAGMPKKVVLRASEMMHHFETNKFKEKDKETLKAAPKTNFYQNSLFEENKTTDPVLEKLKDELLALDINRLSPVEALLKLNEFKIRVGK
ncbi:DNA mismatch repair protein MutS [Bernardetia sp.]|uniref:DNA mismatch repair protein MutS n=1 Tax=Bernardetia sp. TaxID=1937974 RepID=UPI0025C5A066|nr:DNA mismatch repair protein MutS [Bernardetia sp.]